MARTSIAAESQFMADFDSAGFQALMVAYVRLDYRRLGIGRTRSRPLVKRID